MELAPLNFATYNSDQPDSSPPKHNHHAYTPICLHNAYRQAGRQGAPACPPARPGRPPLCTGTSTSTLRPHSRIGLHRGTCAHACPPRSALRRAGLTHAHASALPRESDMKCLGPPTGLNRPPLEALNNYSSACTSHMSVFSSGPAGPFRGVVSRNSSLNRSRRPQPCLQLGVLPRRCLS